MSRRTDTESAYEVDMDFNEQDVSKLSSFVGKKRLIPPSYSLPPSMNPLGLRLQMNLLLLLVLLLVVVVPVSTLRPLL